MPVTNSAVLTVAKFLTLVQVASAGRHIDIPLTMTPATDQDERNDSDGLELCKVDISNEALGKNFPHLTDEEIADLVAKHQESAILD